LRLADGQVVRAARVILATGREPNLAGLGLESLGLDVDASGLSTDPTGRVVGADHLWAAGDVTGIAPFTHTATYQSSLVAANLRGEGRIADYRGIPRVVYTDPPVAAVGVTETSAGEQGLAVAVEEIETGQLARAVTDGTERGALHLIADMNAGVLAGAAAIGPAADEIISELTLAIRARIPLGVLADVVHPFPTYAEGVGLTLGRLAGRE
jgi:dihydrolipoamide dehydrogenase